MHARAYLGPEQVESVHGCAAPPPSCSALGVDWRWRKKSSSPGRNAEVVTSRRGRRLPQVRSLCLLSRPLALDQKLSCCDTPQGGGDGGRGWRDHRVASFGPIG